MQFQSNEWTDQLYQTWKNTANVLDALDACCLSKHLLSCLLFLSDTEFHFDDITAHDEKTSEWTQLCDICTAQMMCNGNVIPGDIDGMMVDPNQEQKDDDEYEDEETRIEDEKNRIPTVHNEDDTDSTVLLLCPILVVTIPKMPVGALCELEVVAASRRATNALHIHNYTRSNSMTSRVRSSDERTEPYSVSQRRRVAWDTGHDFVPTMEPLPKTECHSTSNEILSSPQSNDTATATLTSNSSTNDDVQIDSYFRCLGSSRTASCALVVAHMAHGGKYNTASETRSVADPSTVLHAMIMALKMENHFDSDNILHIRLYYINTSIDGILVRDVLESTMQESFHATVDARPATTVIPVTDMGIVLHHLSQNGKSVSNRTFYPFLAMQALSIDPIRTEQSVWIHEGRHYQ
jgi:hypothetical protein